MCNKVLIHKPHIIFRCSYVPKLKYLVKLGQKILADDFMITAGTLVDDSKLPKNQHVGINGLTNARKGMIPL